MIRITPEQFTRKNFRVTPPPLAHRPEEVFEQRAALPVAHARDKLLQTIAQNQVPVVRSKLEMR